jgi:hypothetical protein
MQVKRADHAVPAELDIHLELIACNRFTTHGARRSISRSAESHAIRSTKRQTPTPDDISRLISEVRLVTHTDERSIPMNKKTPRDVGSVPGLCCPVSEPEQRLTDAKRIW